MAFWRRIGNNKLKIVCRRGYIQLPYWGFHDTPTPTPTRFFNFAAAANPVQFQSKWKKEEDCTNAPRLNDQMKVVADACPRSKRMFSSSFSHDYTSAIQELNKEMESVFGEPPANGLASSVSNSYVNNESQVSSSQKIDESSFELTHTGSSGEAQMVDVSPKENSKRTAIASCKVILGKKVFDLVSANQMAKGDVLTVAKIAGITAAKQTGNLIPLCHNISLTHVQLDLMLNHEDLSVTIEGEAATTGKTGVEMEALTAVCVAGLTVYDMCKAASKDIVITDIRLKHKSGGKSGEWSWRH